ncbi:energy-coupling factor transporter transmembrane component T [Enterococcus hirae]|uniref:energy-coupling factor transporter transmembrane component T n=1 Tax=Enterococcus TaxID=1350 RepID=UPI0015F24893|nr:energy-coupling factor transporter transmembrane component T [Enterococcus hirae]MBA5252609.1 energy-coupling factor transporter transmembrane protein EcfT [Enterococcus hirae]MBS6193040.1 energy-coupling factor transporter transmembrane protein EcfT [Enterococcus hirae]MDU1571302.1 energy-coupling factor transporter transmembrane component T [Enterococcus hirae]MDU4894803.1 energy-coupling factor transporter transmembrane component T [Enterococcus hirae]
MENRKIRIYLPEWINKEDKIKYNGKNKDFVLVNLSIISKILYFFTLNNIYYRSRTTPVIRLLKLFIFSFVIFSSNNLLFIWIILVLLLFNLSFFSGLVLIKIIKKIFKLLIFSIIFLFPSILFQKTNIELFSLRILIGMLNFAIYSSTTNWTQFILSLRQLRIPYVILITFDIALKYIFVLGRYLEDILYNIRLKMLGQNINYKLFGAIIGQLYFISKDKMIELYQVMKIRGYENSLYKKKIKLTKFDFFTIFELMIVLLLFVLFKGE